MTEFALGTVQLGMPYGVTNTVGMPDMETAMAVLDAAFDHGVRTLDTARRYGCAEQRIGAWLRRRGGPEVAVIGKFPPLPPGMGTAAEARAFVRASFDETRRALGVDAIDGYLAHRSADLIAPGVSDALRELQASGCIGRFGASVYGPEDAEAVLDTEGLAILQAPLSLVDRRIVESGVAARCRDRGVALHARSVFLQGLLAVPASELTGYFERLRPVSEGLARLAGEHGVGPEDLALKFVTRLDAVSAVVIGAITVEHIADNVAAMRTPDLSAGLAAAVARLGDAAPADLFDPRLWPKPARAAHLASASGA